MEANRPTIQSVGIDLSRFDDRTGMTLAERYTQWETVESLVLSKPSNPTMILPQELSPDYELFRIIEGLEDTNQLPFWPTYRSAEYYIVTISHWYRETLRDIEGLGRDKLMTV